MTTIKITGPNEYGFWFLEGNSRTLGIPARIESIEKTGPGRREGVANGEPFVIEGGKEAGEAPPTGS